MRFLGYWSAEGHVHHPGTSCYQIVLTQNEGPTLEKINGVIRELGYRPFLRSDCRAPRIKQVAFCDLVLYHWLLELGKAGEKHIPRALKNLPPSALEALVDAHIDGDGTVHKKNGHKVSFTVSRILADDLQELALKIGLSASIRVDRREGFARKLPTGQDIMLPEN